MYYDFIKVGTILNVPVFMDVNRRDNRIDVQYGVQYIRELKMKVLNDKDVKYIDRIYIEGKLFRLLNFP